MKQVAGNKQVTKRANLHSIVELLSAKVQKKNYRAKKKHTFVFLSIFFLVGVIRLTKKKPLPYIPPWV